MWVRLVAIARIPSSVTDEHSLRWSSVSAVRPATAQTFLRGTHDGMQSSGAPACVSNVVTPWLWPLCMWVALLLLLPHPTHARKGGDERDDGEG